MFKNIYTTRMSGNAKILKRRFDRINSNGMKNGKLAALICAVFIVTVFLLSTVVLANFEKEETYTLNITNNGEIIMFENEPFIENGEVYVPLEELFAKIGLMEYGSEIKEDNTVVLILLSEKNLNENIPAEYTSYFYKIEIGKNELVINPDELANMSKSYEAREEKINAPVKKNDVIYIPYSYAERIVERADNGVLSPMDRYKIAVVYSGETLSIAYPLEDYTGISSPFGKRVHPITGEERFHDGTDFKAKDGTEVLSGVDGKVTDEGFDDEYGNYVVITTDYGVEILYAHLSQIERHGSYEVKRGEVIGESGNTGMSTGAHLHMSVKINDEYVDPELYLEESIYDKLIISLDKKIPEALKQAGYTDAEYEIIGSVKCTSDIEMGFVKIKLCNYDDKIVGVVFDYHNNIHGWSGVVIEENYETYEMLFNS